MPKRSRTSSNASDLSTIVYSQGAGRGRYKRMPSMVARGYKLYKRPTMPLYPFKRTCRVVFQTNTNTGFIGGFTDRQIAWSFALDEVTVWYVNLATNQSFTIPGMLTLLLRNHLLSQGQRSLLRCLISSESTELI